MDKQENKKILKTKVLALGGLGEVGKNMYLVQYGDEIIIIDSGILFPDDYLLGIEYVIPDYSYLKENQDKIAALIISHGHEDHIGGIPFLLKSVDIKNVYANGLAYGLVKNKLDEHRDVHTNLINFDENKVYKFKNIKVSFFRTNHSIPDSFGIIIDTPNGKIVHTGDFKFDFTPVGPSADYSKMAELGKQGVLCLLSDSTNAELVDMTVSEKKISQSIHRLFERLPGRVIVATFASNIHRVQEIVAASVATGRKIAVFGRSMEKTIDVGLSLNYIQAPKGTFIYGSEVKKYPDNQITILSTGSQGEPFAALSRIADGSHKQIKIIPGDTVIFSSSPIPGNARSIGETINKLYKLGADVIINSPLTDTHTSGHGGQQELKLMLNLIRPKYFMPIHGEHRMLKKHGEIAQECGVPEKNIFIMDNGDVLSLTRNRASLKRKNTARITAGNIYIDGSAMNDVNSIVIRDRKKLSEDGLLVAIITLDRLNKKILLSPTIVSRGFIYMKKSEDLIKDLQQSITDYVETLFKKYKLININLYKEKISTYIQSLIYEKTQREPMVLPVIMLK